MVDKPDVSSIPAVDEERKKGSNPRTDWDHEKVEINGRLSCFAVLLANKEPQLAEVDEAGRSSGG